MHPVEALTRFGGATSRTRLLRLTDRSALDRLVAAGDIVRDAHGRYALPTADQAIRTASALTGVVSHLSAAAYWGWEVKQQPALPHVTCRSNRNISPEQRRLAVPHWADLGPDDVVDDLVTSRARTLADCLRSLPIDEGLSVADSALRHEDITTRQLLRLAEGVTGHGAVRARRVAAHASPAAANPFESVLRAISLDVAGLDLEPQVAIREGGFSARPDLVDRDRRVVVEADSHTWHSSRAALRRDCRRYTGLTVRGWLVVRFAWEDVMFEPELVREALIALALVAGQRGQPRSRRRTAA